MQIKKARVLVALLMVAWRPGWALSQHGHMVTGALVYDELHDRDPRVAERIADLLSQHPDRGTFEVALDNSSGELRARRIFMEAARWPDDVRKGMFDHPTWHYASRPLTDVAHPPAGKPRDTVAGSANEAFALNISEAGDARAPGPDRAVALCWVLHLAGDIHQPLHAADFYSVDYAKGDHGGGAQYVLDPQTQLPISLHGYWDMAGSRGTEDPAAQAVQLRNKFPRHKYPELLAPVEPSRDFRAWGAEAYEVARTQAYRADLTTANNEKQAPALGAAYQANSVAVAERQLTLSAYRLADLLIGVFHE